MREILFRAKRVDNGEWVEGYPVKYPSGKAEIFKECGEPPDILLRCEIDPETLCQYTDMKDWNGKKIWENDIVYTPYRRFVVTYSDGVWGDRDGISMRESIFGEGGTVIGNIFDNPELLKGE